MAVGSECDRGVGDFRLMDFEFGRIGIGPVGDIDEHANLANGRCRNFERGGGGFEDIESDRCDLRRFG